MAAFMIFCRTTEVSPQHYEARVFVVAAGEAEAAMATRSESRIFESAGLAATECARMSEAMAARLRRAGHEVVRVDAGAGAPALATPASSAGTNSH